MADLPFDNLPDGLFDDATISDPIQRALHGMLTAYFNPPNPEWGAQIATAVAHSDAASIAMDHTAVAAETVQHPGILRLPRRLRALPRFWLFASGIAAAILFPLAIVIFQIAPAVPASAQTALQRGAQAPIFAFAFIDPLISDDPAAFDKRLNAIAAATAKRDDLLSRFNLTDPLAKLPRFSGGDPLDRRLNNGLEAWAGLVRGLRDIGAWKEAQAELDDAIFYTSDLRLAEYTRAWHWIFYCDLGDMHLMLGEFDAARDAYQKSLQLRKAEGDPRDPNSLIHAKVQHQLPMFWRLSDVQLAAGDLPSARRWLTEADDALAAFFRAQAHACGVEPPAEGVSALDAYRALPPEFRAPAEWRTDAIEIALPKRFGLLAPNASHADHLRAQMLHLARVTRLEGDPAGAAHLLQTSIAEVPYSARHDEYQLLFYERLEAARIAIAQQDFAAALTELDAAAQETDEVTFPQLPDLIHPAVNAIGLAELNLLRGAALLGQQPDSRAGVDLIQAAVRVPNALAARLPADAAARFNNQFAAWRGVLPALAHNFQSTKSER